MHGRLKVKTTIEKEREKNVERKKKMHAFQALTAVIMKHRAEGPLDETLLQRTRDILAPNPDFYTLWNIRREVLLQLKQNNSEESEKHFEKELEFVVECLKVNPKSYGAWQQRCFVQTTMEHPDWSNELSLCSQFLEADDRNFHCWDYRRFVVEKGNVPTSPELLFTTHKINNDFSNFSSWHYRGSLLKKMSEDGGSDGELDAGTLLKELSLVENALFTDPNDQSAWFYHGWLLSDKAKMVRLESVVVEEGSGVVALLFNRPVKLHTDVHIDVHTDSLDNLHCQWKGVTESPYNKIFIGTYNVDTRDNHNTIPNNNTTPSNNTTPNNISNPNNNKNNTIFKEIVVEVKGSRVVGGKVVRVVEMEGKGGALVSSTETNRLFSNSTEHTTLLNNHLQSLQQLQTLEPNNKWIIMAISKLVRLLDKPEDDAIEGLERLAGQDVYRRCYYQDIVAKIKIERKLKEHRTNKSDQRSDHSKQRTDEQIKNTIDLSHLSLTTLHHTDQLIVFQNIDLSNNQLTSLITAHHCMFLVRLTAASNRIRSCSGMCGWVSLQFLDLSHNDLRCLEDLEDLKDLRRLRELTLVQNPLECGAEEMRELLPSVESIHV